MVTGPRAAAGQTGRRVAARAAGSPRTVTRTKEPAGEAASAPATTLVARRRQGSGLVGGGRGELWTERLEGRVGRGGRDDKPDSDTPVPGSLSASDSD